MARAALLLSVVVLTACTSEGPGTATGPSSQPAATTPAPEATSSVPAAVPSPSPTTTAAPAVPVDTETVAGVPMGTPAEEAERRLRAVLGAPTSSDPLPGCYGETGRDLTWDTLTVYLSDSASGPVLLSGWAVGRGTSRWRWQLPYDVAAGDSVGKALREVPGATGGVPEEGENTMFFVVRSSRVPRLTWTSTTADESGQVDTVDYQAEACD